MCITFCLGCCVYVSKTMYFILYDIVKADRVEDKSTIDNGIKYETTIAFVQYMILALLFLKPYTHKENVISNQKQLYLTVSNFVQI